MYKRRGGQHRSLATCGPKTQISKRLLPLLFRLVSQASSDDEKIQCETAVDHTPKAAVVHRQHLPVLPTSAQGGAAFSSGARHEPSHAEQQCHTFAQETNKDWLADKSVQRERARHNMQVQNTKT